MKGGVADNVFAAGEIMAGNILGKGYVAGVGMTIGTVFGEIAGVQAVRLLQPARSTVSFAARSGTLSERESQHG